jgi:uncharacterized Zn finger protein
VPYGIGARLDKQPELLFKLRNVDHEDLIAQAGSALPLSRAAPAANKILASDGLSELFGLDIGAVQPSKPVPPERPKRRARGRTAAPPARPAAKARAQAARAPHLPAAGDELEGEPSARRSSWS